METKPKEITETLELSASAWDHSTLDEVIEELKTFRGEGWEEWSIEAYDHYAEIVLFRKRLETEEEVTRRLLREEASKQYRRKQYEALRKEFEGQND